MSNIFQIVVGDFATYSESIIKNLIPFWYVIAVSLGFFASFTLFLTISYDCLKHIMRIQTVKNPQRLLILLIASGVLTVMLFIIGWTNFGRDFIACTTK